MNQKELHELLLSLIETWENEVVEFKEADKNYETQKIYRYFSAISNEANLRNLRRGWLIIGVRNTDHKIVGTDYCKKSAHLQNLKHQVKQSTGFSFIDIHELFVEGARVLMLEIPPAPRGIPVFTNGHAYARAGESLIGLDMSRLDAIRNQTLSEDWSAQIVENASIADLDSNALKKARLDFAKKQESRISAEEIDSWSDETFLGKLHLMANNKLTRAAILLFGKEESWHFLSPHPAQLTWSLKGQEEAYEHFHLPFYLATSELYSKIRNIKLRILPDDSLVSVEVAKYDKDVVMEALHNCIIHQDYTQNARITVTEFLDRLEFLNAGYFFEGQPSDYIEGNLTPQRYRNPCLAQAMVQLNMIDSMGRGIARIYKTQAKRYFPLPDYELPSNQVKLTIHGKVVDPAYTRLLIQKTDLLLSDILALDRVQKNLSIPDEVAKHLRKKGLIEGRKPHLHISADVAKVSPESCIEYVRRKGQQTDFYEKQILDLLKLRSASREDIEKLLLNQLSTSLTEEQKKKKIGNLLHQLGKKGKIKSQRKGKSSLWHLAEE